VKILVTGSIAYDTIMVFPDRFRNHLLADQLHILNVCFLTPEMRREYGGTAGNIAYNLRLLGAQAFITTDLDDNQITAFHPGAMNYAHENHVRRELAAGIAIIAPDGKQGMQQHARECAEAGVPFIFDPGQGLPMFSGEELSEFVRLADYVAVNDYEGRLLEEKTGRRLEDFARELKGLVVTLGAKGSLVLAGGQRHEIPCVPAEALADPTGCGDAYRAGLLYGLAQGWDWPSTGKLGAVMGAIKIAHRGAQNHAPARGEIEARFQRAFGYSPWKG
jgi:adenosine kinase